MKFTICYGNAFDGLSLEGIFDTPEEAVESAENGAQDEEWNIVPIKEIT